MENATLFDVVERIAALIRSEERKKCTEYGLQTVHLQACWLTSRAATSTATRQPHLPITWE